MTWPLSQDFNEAVQNPRTAFADPDLAAGTTEAGPGGLPRPRSGNFADVYSVASPGGKKWAIKLFTRPVGPNLEARYAAVAEHLARVNLPFAVGFEYLPQGVKVRGKWYPAVKMPWVDGFPVNQFVRENLTKAGPLEAMLSLWVRLCRRLREAEVTHGDLQHGNVLLVPGGKANALGLKLVDYDGVYVPALADKPSGETGHSAYQHPERVAKNIYSADLDRFPHLVVATALRALLVGGKPLYDKYDTGDNLLFTERDFRNPGQSKLMRELWDGGDPFAVGLLGHLVLASQKPMANTPWLDQLMPEGRPPTLTPSQERQASDLLGRTIVPVPAPPVPPLDDPPPIPIRSGKRFLGVAILGGLLTIGVLTGAVLAVSFFGDDSKKKESAKKEKAADTKPVEPPVEPAKPPEVVKPPEVAKPPEPVKPPEPPPKPMTTVPVVAVPAAPKLLKEALAPVVAGTPAGVKFSPDGTRLFLGEDGMNSIGQVHTLDGETLAKSATFKELTAARRVPFAPIDRTDVLAAGGEGFLVAFRADTGKGIGRIVAPTALNAVAVAVAPTGRFALLVTAGGGATQPGRTVVIDIVNNVEVYAADTLSNGRQPAAAFASDGSRLAVSDPMGKVTLIALPGKTVIGTVPVKGAVQAWSAAKNLLAVRPTTETGGVTANILVVDPAGKKLAELAGNYAPAPPLFSADGKFLYAASGQAVEVWDTTTWLKTTDIVLPRAQVADFDVRADGKRLAAVGRDRKLYLFDMPADRFAVAAPVMPNGMAAMPADAPRARKPAPDPVAKLKADDQVRAAYKDDFAKKTPADRKKLADKLLAAAAQTMDADGKYAMLDEVKKIGGETLDLPLALKAITALDAEYDIDGAQEKVVVVERAAFAVSQPAAIKQIAEVAAELVDEFADKDEYEKAAKLAGIAATLLTRSAQPALAKELTDRQTLLRKQKEQFDPVRAAAETLKTKPDDPAANVLVGKYRCVVQRRWDDGLPMLKKGNDAALKKLAEQDLATEGDVTDLMRGDAWVAYAKTLPEADHRSYELRGRYWYTRAVAGAKGLELETAKKKLEFTLAGTEYRPGLVAVLVPMSGAKGKRLTRVDPLIDVTGPQLRDALQLGGGGEVRVVWSGVIVPPVGGRFKLVADTKDAVTVRVGLKPDDKLVINARTASDTFKRDASLLLADRPVPLVVEYQGKVAGANRLRLMWVRPGSAVEEPVPAECLFHTKADEKLLDGK